MAIIFDEYKHVEKILNKGLETKRNNKFELQLIATYFREMGQSDSEIAENLHLFCKKYVLNYNRVKFYKIIDEKVRKSNKYKLKRAVAINITQNELDIILAEENLKCQKLMFVYLVLAKYYMSINKVDKYYVGCKDNDIFKLCDMYVKKQDKLDTMPYLPIF